MTFSIIARCPRSGQFGVGAVTAMVAVGKLVAHAFPGAGAIATQATVNPYIGLDGIGLLRRGLSARKVVEHMLEADPGRENRQFAVLDAEGRTEAWTGAETLEWSGSLSGEGFSVQGNRLAGEQVLEATASAFEADPDAPLADRLLAALEAGTRVGGDTKGERSATIYVVDTEEYPLWDIRVDEHEKPIDELKRLHGIVRRELLPNLTKMPTRDNPAGEAGERSA